MLEALFVDSHLVRGNVVLFTRRSISERETIALLVWQKGRAENDWMEQRHAPKNEICWGINSTQTGDALFLPRTDEYDYLLGEIRNSLRVWLVWICYSIM